MSPANTLGDRDLSTFARWMKFNLVGAIGIAVQFGALMLLKSLLHFDYLVATAIAVEAAVVHNFIWHEQFTWSDRVSAGRIIAAKNYPHSRRRSLARFLRFNLTVGAVSIIGNLALMKVMAGIGHMNYLVANAIAIVLCSAANFLVTDQWIFQQD
jgi:putative flippase GtrA